MSTCGTYAQTPETIYPFLDTIISAKDATISGGDLGQEI